MKQTKQVKVSAKPAKPARTKEVDIYKCDFCKATIDKSLDNTYGSGASACQVCSRDVCHKCLILVCDDWSYEPCDHYCSICRNLWFNTYKGLRQEIIQYYHDELERLDRKIKRESLKTSCNSGKTPV